jgi:hypothetical protein
MRGGRRGGEYGSWEQDETRSDREQRWTSSGSDMDREENGDGFDDFGAPGPRAYGGSRSASEWGGRSSRNPSDQWSQSGSGYSRAREFSGQSRDQSTPRYSGGNYGGFVNEGSSGGYGNEGFSGGGNYGGNRGFSRGFSPQGGPQSYGQNYGQTFGQGYAGGPGGNGEGDGGRQGSGYQRFGNEGFGGGRGYRAGRGFAGRGPKGYQRSDERIKEQVSDRLMDDDDVDASDITVEVKNAEVTLSGTVNSRQEKRAAEETAEQCAGVREVLNHLRINPSQTSSTGHAMSSQSGSSAQSTSKAADSTSPASKSRSTERE